MNALGIMCLWMVYNLSANLHISISGLTCCIFLVLSVCLVAYIIKTPLLVSIMDSQVSDLAMCIRTIKEKQVLQLLRKEEVYISLSEVSLYIGPDICGLKLETFNFNLIHSIEWSG